MTQARTTPALTTHVQQIVQPDTIQTRRIYNPVQKDAATFVRTAEESGGVNTLIDLEVAPGGGNSLHYHRSFAEHFTVISGEIGVQIGKEQFKLQRGQSAVAPIMALHRWYNTSQETAVVRVELRPGNTGFERSLQIAYGLARDNMVNKRGLPKSIVHAALLFDLADTGVPGVFSMLAPLLRIIAARGRRNGVERELIARYCL